MDVNVDVDLKPKKITPQHQSVIEVLRKETSIKCLILTFLIWACISAITWCRVKRTIKINIDFHSFPITSNEEISACEDGFLLIPVAFVLMLYLLYLVECWHSTTWSQLKARKTEVYRTYQLLNELRQSHPLVWWKGVCYHYCKRRREIRHKNHSYTTTQIYYEKINSFMEKSCFYSGFCGQRDISPDVKKLEKYAFTKIKISKGFLFANNMAVQDYLQQKSYFHQNLQGRDDYVEMKESFDLSHSHFGKWEEEVVCGDEEKPPWYGRPCLFWIANCLLLSWPFRFKLALNTATLNFQVTKLFGTNYILPAETPPTPPLLILSSPSREEEEDTLPLLQEETSSCTNKEDYIVWECPKLHPLRRSIGFNMIKRSVTLLITKTEREQFDFEFLPDKDSSPCMEESRESLGYAPTYSQALLWSGLELEKNCRDQVANSSLVPSYMEALKTSRPIFFPRWTSLRRCFTQRDLNHSQVWTNQSKPGVSPV